ncbi:hypothetical protein TNCT_548341 [Trichonephila clavata]|uniref:Uncharacterized protein n=1 Tax=Trichonephila clavata TaxID=2740835 RepID=A0A8X6G5W7_TRICU|nr:hypothetical protein TNCT_548341 [Trichonephila clavata]
MAPTNDELYRDLSNLPMPDNADPCKMHQNMEYIILKALLHRTYYQQTLEYAQKNPKRGSHGDTVVYDEDLINQLQKDIAAVNVLMERLRGELAPSYPCPNPDCYAHNKIPDLTYLENTQFTWQHTNTTHKTNNDYNN